MNTNPNIKRIIKQFLCASPISDINFQTIPVEWTSQAYLVERTVKSEAVLKFPIKISYQKTFLKRLIDNLTSQNVEVNDTLYNELGRLMALSEPMQSYKHYVFAGKSLVLNEAPSFVSEGTTGLCTWQASLALCEWCLKNKDIFENKTVLELGSGVGLTGLVLNKIYKMKKYYFTDHHSSVLNYLRRNIETNLDDQESKNVRILNLPWESIKSKGEEIHDVDVTIAADVVYDQDLFLPLIKAIRFLFKSKRCLTLFLACTERNPDTLQEFLNLLDDYHVDLLKLYSPEEFYWSSELSIKIFKITCK